MDGDDCAPLPRLQTGPPSCVLRASCCSAVGQALTQGGPRASAGCPLCMEDLDITDRNFRPCKCGYQICLFCYRHIKDDLNGLCPACRTPYDDSNVSFVAPDPLE